MAINFPFNFQPYSISVQTGAYSIPAGYYARVVANVSPTGSFTINGSTALAGYQNSTTQTTNTSTQLKMVKTLSDPTRYISLSTQTGAATATDSDQGAAFGYGSATFTDSNSMNADYWVPSGTSLNVSSGRYVVTLYPNIT